MNISCVSSHKPVVLTILSIFAFLFSYTSSFAQTNRLCLTDEWIDELQNTDSATLKLDEARHSKRVEYYRHIWGDYVQQVPNSLDGGSTCPKPTFLLPVVVHVIYNSGLPATKIDSNQIFKQIEKLNNAFAGELSDSSIDTKIQFCLAKTKPDGTAFGGINYIQDNTRTFNGYHDIQNLIDTVYYASNRYINIYVVQNIDDGGTGGTVLGYSTLPYSLFSNKDGIVIRYDWFGDYDSSGSPLNSQSKGLVLVHEMGHMLGLYHPWRGGCNVKDSECSTKGDLCCDIPQIGQETSQCSFPISSCKSGVNVKTENFMDYTPGSCKTTFSPNQVEVMYSILLSVRSDLHSPTNINALNLECCQLSTRIIGSGVVCRGEDIYLEAYEYPGASYDWRLKHASAPNRIYNGRNLFRITKEGISDLALGKWTVELHITVNGTQLYDPKNSIIINVIDCDSVYPSEDAHWYFGNHAGISFYKSGAVPNIFADNRRLKDSSYSINTDEGIANLSDSTGNFLFVASPDTSSVKSTPTEINIFSSGLDRVSGTALNGSNTASQGVAAIPYPGQDSTYLVFHHEKINNNTREHKPLYSVLQLDTTGEIVKIANSSNLILRDTNSAAVACSEGITLVSQCGDSTWWLLIPDYIPAPTLQVGIHLFKVTGANGIEYVNTQTFNGLTNWFSSIIEFNKTGTMFLLDHGLYTFDRSNGNISLFRQESYDSEWIYGVSFSPNGEFVYRCGGPIDSVNDDKLQLYQFDPYADNLEKSKRFVATDGVFRFLQRGPDDKIYSSNDEQRFLGVINLPNNRVGVAHGNECDFKEFGIALTSGGFGGTCANGLPNIIDAKNSIDIEIGFKVAHSNCFSIELIPNQCCADTYIWDFGDGSGTSTDKFPSYTFSSGGTYTIKLISEGDTAYQTIEIGIDTSDFNISGPFSFCDSTRIYEYEFNSDSLSQNDYQYSWRVKGASNIFYLSADSSAISTSFNGSDSVYLGITDIISGCKSEKGISIVKQPGATISDSILPISQFICAGMSPDSLIHKTKSDTITYEWYKRNKGSTSWSLISGATGWAYQPQYDTTDIEYICIAQAGCTELVSVVSTVEYVKSTDNPSLLAPLGAPDGAGIDNYEPLTIILPTKVIWQYNPTIRADSSNWVPGDTFVVGSSIRFLRKTLGNTKDIGVRRITKYLQCIDTSNVDTIFTGEPLSGKGFNQVQFCYSTSYDTIIGISLSDDTSTSFHVEWRKVPYPVYAGSGMGFGSETLLDTIYADGNIFLPLSGNSPIRQFYVASIEHYFHSGSEDSANIYYSKYFFEFNVDTSILMITSHPNNQVVSNGSSISFSVTCSGANNSTQYQWQSSSDNGSTFFNIRGKNTSTLSFSQIQLCQDGIQYRCRVVNACDTVFSNAATLTVTGSSATSFDFWIKDSYKDVGDEPNSNVIDITPDIYMSPDIWNRQEENDTTGLSHQNPEWKTKSDNTIRVKIRNRGADTSANGILRLYWTYGATGEIWDKSWIDAYGNWFWNEDSLAYYPMGSEITNTNGFSIPAIPPGDSVIVSYGWRPPNPYWYYHGDKKYSSNPVVCVYARIEECNQYPFGMTYPEQFNEVVTDNIKQNNNIATRNMRVMDSAYGNLNLPGDWILVGRDGNINPDGIIRIHPEDNSHLDYWNVFLELDDAVYEAWDLGGSNGYSFALTEPQTVKALSHEFYLENILFSTDQIGYVRPKFVATVDPDSLPEEKFIFYLTQYSISQSNPVGGFAYVLDNEDGKMTYRSSLYKTSPLSVDTTLKNLNFIWSIVPNPAKNTITIQVLGSRKIGYKIAIMNNMGQIVRTLNMDSNREKIDVSNLRSGIYYVRLTTGNIVETKKVLLIK